MNSVELKKIEYPEVSEPMEFPRVPDSVYQDRLDLFRGKIQAEGLSHGIVYGDREHFANLKFLTDYDPRFEESLLIVPASGKPVLLVGNEGWGYSKICKIDCDVKLYQHFSLQGQPRSKSKTLETLLGESGIDSDSKIGVCGIKYVGSDEFGPAEFVIDAPSYIVECLRSMAGYKQVTDITRWFTHPSTGFRIPLTVDEIARFETINLTVYRGVKNALEAFQEGVSEMEISKALNYSAVFPLSCHVAIGFGENAELGLGSPTERKLEKGDFVSFGFGVWGANIARSGLAVSSPEELPKEIADAMDKIYIPYFKALITWYKSLKVGVTAGEVYENVKHITEDPFYGVSLNPGHQIREEEWINSPFLPGSEDVLVSGTFLQCDYIIGGSGSYSGIHTEDGLVLADKALRDELAKKYPESWKRIQDRRKRMEAIGYELDEDILPLSDMQGYVAPFLLNPGLILSAVEG